MQPVAKNKKAYHDYEIVKTFEAGVVLLGDEVKSIRAGTVSLSEAFGVIKDGEVLLINCHIGPYSHAYQKTTDTRRSRKLLLNKAEIRQIMGALTKKGLTLVPLSLYFTERGYLKVQLGLAKHKSLVNRKRELKERDITRETHRAVKERLGE